MELVYDSLPTVSVPTSTAEDTLLAAWAQHGDREALGELFASCRSRAYALAVRLCGPGEAEDAVHDGYLLAMQQAKSWRGQQAVGWVLAVVANAARGRRRSAQRRMRREGHQPSPPPPPVAADDLAPEVLRALEALPEHQRQPIELRYLAGLELTAVAEALGRPYKTVHGQIERGLERLRQTLAQRGLAAGTAAIAACLAEPAPAAEPPHLAEAVRRVAATGPAAAEGVPILAWAAGLLLMLVCAAVVWSQRSPGGGAPASFAVADTETQPPADPPAAAADVLEQLVTVRFAHDRVDEALAALARATSPQRRLRYAIFPPLEADAGLRGPLGGLVWDPPGPVRVREALDALAAQTGLAWSLPHGIVAVYRPVADAAAVARATLARAVGPKNPADLPTAEVQKEANRLFVAAVCTPEGLAAALAYVLSPEYGIAQVDTRLLTRRKQPLVFAEDAWVFSRSANAIEPERISPLESIADRTLGKQAREVLRAAAVGPGPELIGESGEWLLWTRLGVAGAVAAASGTREAADDLFRLFNTPHAVIHGGMMLAQLDDPRAGALLVKSVEQWGRYDVFDGKTELLAALGRGGAWEALEGSIEGFDRLAWSRDPAIRQRLETGPIDPKLRSQVCRALLRMGSARVPPGLAEALTQPVERPGHLADLAFTLARCLGLMAAEDLLAWAGRVEGAAWFAGLALAEIEDPALVARLASELQAPASPGRATAAAIGLAGSRMKGAAEPLRQALTADGDGGDPLWWAGALAGRDEPLALMALAQAVRRPQDRETILARLRQARCASVVRDAWSLVANSETESGLRRSVLTAIADGDSTSIRPIPERDAALAAVLAQTEGPEELRVMALGQAGAHRLPGCRSALATLLEHDPSPWVRASAVYQVSFIRNSYGPVDFDVLPDGDSAWAPQLVTERLRRDPSPQVRSYAAIGTDDPDILIAALAAEGHPRVRETIALVLGQRIAGISSKTFADGLWAKTQEIARRLLPQEGDAAARHALQGLAERKGETALRVKPDGSVVEGGERTSQLIIRHTNLKTGRSWSRHLTAPVRLSAEAEDPGLPFYDG